MSSKIPIADAAQPGSWCSQATGPRERRLIWPDATTLKPFILTTSQPPSLQSMAGIKSAKSRWISASSSRALIAQTRFGLSGRFCLRCGPCSQQGEAHEWLASMIFSMTELPIRYTVSHRQHDFDSQSYHKILRRIRGPLRALIDHIL